MLTSSRPLFFASSGGCSFVEVAVAVGVVAGLLSLPPGDGADGGGDERRAAAMTTGQALTTTNCILLPPPPNLPSRHLPSRR